MAEDHVITAAQAAAAKAEPIVPSAFRRPRRSRAPTGSPRKCAASWSARSAQEPTTQGGLMVRTSLDPALQAAAESRCATG